MNTALDKLISIAALVFIVLKYNNVAAAQVPFTAWVSLILAVGILIIANLKK
jgi:hypothetical protein